MSLVAAYQLPGHQYWCADRTLVRWCGPTRRVVARDHRKLHPLPDRPVVLGLSGSAYDADHILGIVTRAVDAVSALVDFMAMVRAAVRDVNACSAEFARERGLAQHLTGALVGGTWDGTWFLHVIPPDGADVRMTRYGAIGMASARLRAEMWEALEGATVPSQVEDALDAGVRGALGEEGAVLDRLVVDPFGVSPWSASDA